MTNSNAFESYVSAHMMPSLGFASSNGHGGQRQQLWDWDAAAAATTQPTNVISLHPSLFSSGSSSNAFYDCAAIPFASLAAGNGGGGGYSFYAGMAGEYLPVQGLAKSGEDLPLGQIGLKLGHRTYFPMLRQNAPRCQAEGCNADLAGAKHYHRRHKVCEYHSKATVVVVAGLQQRFCQQCSRFHVLSEFDEAKRSCRKRLADHNLRRRKAQQLPSAVASERSAPPRFTPTEKKETSPKPTKGGATGKDVTNTTTGFSSVSNHISMESRKDYQKKASPLRHGPALSLGGSERTGKGSFGFNSTNCPQRPWPVISDGNSGSPQQQEQQHITSSSSGTFFPRNFCCSSNDASLTANGGGCDQSHDHNSFLHHGQGIFEVDYFM